MNLRSGEGGSCCSCSHFLFFIFEKKGKGFWEGVTVISYMSKIGLIPALLQYNNPALLIGFAFAVKKIIFNKSFHFYPLKINFAPMRTFGECLWGLI